MPDSTRLEQSKLPPEEREVARRLREARRRGRFSLAELAAACELTKSALQHYEDGDAPLTFPAAQVICRFLDTSQAWLATGGENDRPFIDLSALDVDAALLEIANPQTLFEAATGVLRSAFEEWLASNPMELLTAYATTPGPLPLLANLLTPRLELLLAETAGHLLENEDAVLRRGFLGLLRDVLAELQSREGRKISVDGIIHYGQLSPMQIATKLKKARKALGMTAEQAAAHWDIPVSTLRKWEGKFTKPRGLALRQLETILRAAEKPNG